MTKGTFFQSFASLFVASNKSTGLPVFAELGIIAEQIWFSSEILEVMRVHTLCFVMLMIIGTPFSLKVEDVEVEVLVTRE